MARGSNCEVQTQLNIAKELGYGEAGFHDNAENLSQQVSRMLHAILEKLSKPKSLSIDPWSLIPDPSKQSELRRSGFEGDQNASS